MRSRVRDEKNVVLGLPRLKEFNQIPSPSEGLAHYDSNSPCDLVSVEVTGKCDDAGRG